MKNYSSARILQVELATKFEATGLIVGIKRLIDILDQPAMPVTAPVNPALNSIRPPFTPPMANHPPPTNRGVSFNSHGSSQLPPQHILQGPPPPSMQGFQHGSVAPLHGLQQGPPPPSQPSFQQGPPQSQKGPPQGYNQGFPLGRPQANPPPQSFPQNTSKQDIPSSVNAQSIQGLGQTPYHGNPGFNQNPQAGIRPSQGIITSAPPVAANTGISQHHGGFQQSQTFSGPSGPQGIHSGPPTVRPPTSGPPPGYSGSGMYRPPGGPSTTGQGLHR